MVNQVQHFNRGESLLEKTILGAIGAVRIVTKDTRRNKTQISPAEINHRGKVPRGRKEARGKTGFTAGGRGRKAFGTEDI